MKPHESYTLVEQILEKKVRKRKGDVSHKFRTITVIFLFPVPHPWQQSKPTGLFGPYFSVEIWHKGQEIVGLKQEFLVLFYCVNKPSLKLGRSLTCQQGQIAWIWLYCGILFNIRGRYFVLKSNIYKNKLISLFSKQYFTGYHYNLYCRRGIYFWWSNLPHLPLSVNC